MFGFMLGMIGKNGGGGYLIRGGGVDELFPNMALLLSRDLRDKTLALVIRKQATVNDCR